MKLFAIRNSDGEVVAVIAAREIRPSTVGPLVGTGNHVFYMGEQDRPVLLMIPDSMQVKEFD